MNIWNFREKFRLYNQNLPLYIKEESGRIYPLTWQCPDYKQDTHRLFTGNLIPITLKDVFQFLDMEYGNRGDIQIWLRHTGPVSKFEVVYMDGKLVFCKK